MTFHCNFCSNDMIHEFLTEKACKLYKEAFGANVSEKVVCIDLMNFLQAYLQYYLVYMKAKCKISKVKRYKKSVNCKGKLLLTHLNHLLMNVNV